MSEAEIMRSLSPHTVQWMRQWHIDYAALAALLRQYGPNVYEALGRLAMGDGPRELITTFGKLAVDLIILLVPSGCFATLSGPHALFPRG